jgi:integral membrane protein
VDIGETAELFFTMLATALGRLRLIGFLEGISYLLLLGVAMPLKYLAGEPMAVRTVGMAHGILFLLYLLALVPVGLDRHWSWKTFALGALASVLPCGPFVFDAKVLRPLAPPL